MYNPLVNSLFKTVKQASDNTLLYETEHDKTNKIIFAPSVDSDQPGPSPSLIGVFAVRMKKHWVLGYL